MLSSYNIKLLSGWLSFSACSFSVVPILRGQVGGRGYPGYDNICLLLYVAFRPMRFAYVPAKGGGGDSGIPIQIICGQLGGGSLAMRICVFLYMIFGPMRFACTPAERAGGGEREGDSCTTDKRPCTCIDEFVYWCTVGVLSVRTHTQTVMIDGLYRPTHLYLSRK